MTAGACKHVKTCPTRSAHEPVYTDGEWFRQHNLNLQYIVVAGRICTGIKTVSTDVYTVPYSHDGTHV